MKSTFKAQFLQNLVRKNKSSEGFTLIELLVVIIIVGVLSAIALPSFLNQVGKARNSEAKTNLGALNRAQQSYRLENGSFGALASLDATVTGKNFSYAVSGTPSATDANMTGTPVAKDVKGYASRVAQDASNNFKSIICETTANSAAAAGVPTGVAADAALACAASSQETK